MSSSKHRHIAKEGEHIKDASSFLSLHQYCLQPEHFQLSAMHIITITWSSTIPCFYDLFTAPPAYSNSTILISLLVRRLPPEWQTWGRYHGGRRPSSGNSFHSPTVIPPSALDKPSIMQHYHRQGMCSHTSPHCSLMMVMLHDTQFVKC